LFSPETASSSSAAPDSISERRRRRSNDTVTALHYQLSFTRTQASLEAVVLVDDSGCLVAGAGAWPACEELAAYAPFFANPGATRNSTVGSRIAAISADVEVRTVQVGGAEVLLCGRGGGAGREALISRAADGCRRILCAAD
jgi:hypothetical protein